HIWISALPKPAGTLFRICSFVAVGKENARAWNALSDARRPFDDVRRSSAYFEITRVEEERVALRNPEACPLAHHTIFCGHTNVRRGGRDDEKALLRFTSHKRRFKLSSSPFRLRHNRVPKKELLWILEAARRRRNCLHGGHTTNSSEHRSHLA